MREVDRHGLEALTPKVRYRLRWMLYGLGLGIPLGAVTALLQEAIRAC